jgi:hypothetical protein
VSWPSRYDIENIPKRSVGQSYEGAEFLAAVHHHGRPFGPGDKQRQLPYGFIQDKYYKGPPVRDEFDERAAWLKESLARRYGN